MYDSAHPPKERVLLTNLDSYFAVELTKSLIAKGIFVYAISNRTTQLIENRHFTLLDIDLSQPIPNYLPNFKSIFHFAREADLNVNTSPHHFSTLTKNILSLGKNSKVFVILSLKTPTNYIDALIEHENLKVFLIGDIYGPGQNYHKLQTAESILEDFIRGAIVKKRIILENEGQHFIYPTYISDAVFAVNKFTNRQDPKNLRTIVSEQPKNALEIAYEIQNQMALILNVYIDLFFSGEAKHIKKNIAAHQVQTAHLGFEPKVKLEEGLKYIFEELKNSKSNLGEEAPPTNYLPLNQKPHHKHKPQKSISSVPGSRPLAVARLKHLSKLKNPKFAALIVLIIFAFIIKISLNLGLAANDLKSSQNALNLGNFQIAQQKAQKASQNLNSAQSTLNFLLSPISLAFSQKSTDLNLTISSALYLTNAIDYFSQASQNLTKNFQSIASASAFQGTQDVQQTKLSFQKAYFLSAQSSSLASNKNGINLFASQEKTINSYSQNLANLSSNAFQLTSLLTDITGTSGEKKYLVLVQDNTQLRPGGGQIAAFALIIFKDGKLQNINFENIEKADSLLKEKIPPPKSLSDNIGLKQLYLKDVNFSPDLSANSQVAQDIFKKETGTTVDGVLAFDLDFITALLKKSGSVKFANREINSQNFLQNYLSINDTAFLPAIIQEVLQNLLQQLTSNANYDLYGQIEQIGRALEEKHLLASLGGDVISPYIKAKHFDNALPPFNFDPAHDNSQTRDFLSLSETNTLSNKANYYLQRRIDYQVGTDISNQLTSNLRITYTNKSGQDNYNQFLTVFVPKGAILQDFQVQGVSKITGAKVEDANNLTSFSSTVSVPPNSKVEVAISYGLNKILKVDQLPTYALYVQKQPGTQNDPFTLTLNLPTSIQVDSVNGGTKEKGTQNLKLETDLSTDRQFEIGLTKR